MGKRKLGRDEQDEIVAELEEGMNGMDGEEWEELYEKKYGLLDADHQMELDQSIRDFADNAVGSPNWDSDETGGYAEDD